MLALLRHLEKRAGALIAASRGNPLADKIERAIGRIHRRANNVNFDITRNGELRVIELLATLDPQVIFDVGANHGEWTDIVARRCPDCAVHAFEIVPETFHILTETAKRHPRVVPVNVGFSGGEKKRNEMVQMGIIDPALAILDETDSGLDIDALRIVGDGINRIMRKPDKAVLLITHYQRLLDYVKPDFVHVLADGRITRTGGAELALELERDGYKELAA